MRTVWCNDTINKPARPCHELTLNFRISGPITREVHRGESRVGGTVLMSEYSWIQTKDIL